MNLNLLADFLPLTELLDIISECLPPQPGIDDKKCRVATAAGVLRQQCINHVDSRPNFYVIDEGGLPVESRGNVNDVMALLLGLCTNIRRLPTGFFTPMEGDGFGSRVTFRRGHDSIARGYLEWLWHVEYSHSKNQDPNTRATQMRYPMSAKYCKYRYLDPTAEPELVTPSAEEISDAIALCTIGFSREKFAAWARQTDLAALELDANATAPTGAPKNDKPPTWIIKAQEIAQRIGTKRWFAGQRQITSRNVAGAVTIELEQDISTYGLQGKRGEDNVRNVGLKGWVFTPPI